MSSDVRSAEFVTSLARGLSVMRSFGHESREQTLAEVAAATGLTRATARRFLLTLVDLGYARSDGKRFRLTPRVLDLGYAYLSSMELWDVAQPVLEDIMREVDESCWAGMLDGTDMVYVAGAPKRRLLSVNISVGTRLPAHATGMGRVLLAALPPEELDRFFERSDLPPLTPRTITDETELRVRIDRARRDGFCLIEEEVQLGLCAIAVPILDGKDRVVAAMSVATHYSRMSPAELKAKVLPHLQRAAESMRPALPG